MTGRTLTWPNARDLALWLVLYAGAYLIELGRTGSFGHAARPGIAALLLVAVTVARRVPVATLLLIGAVAMADSPALFDSVLLPALVVFAGLAGLRAPRLRAGLCCLSALVIGAAVDANLRADDAWAWFNPVLLLVGGVVFPWLVGFHRARRAARAAADVDRRHRAVVHDAQLRERTRISADMHDSLGHELSLLAVRAGALELATDLPEQHRRAAGELRAAAGAATARLHEIIDVLRDEAAGTPVADDPAPDDLMALVERARDSGMTVRWRRGSAPVVPPAALHRVLQESLTNAAKHAPGRPVTATLDTVPLDPGSPDTGPPGAESVGTGSPARAAVTELRVVTPLAADGAAGCGPHRGLARLAERVDAAGGTLRAGPAGDRFEVVARLPTRPTPADAPAEHPALAGRRSVAERRGIGARLAGAVRSLGAAPDAGGTPPDDTRRAPDGGRTGSDGGRTAPDGAVPGATGAPWPAVRHGWLREAVDTLAMPSAITIGLMATIGVVALASYTGQALTAQLSPTAYAGLHVGDRRAEVERVLPLGQAPDVDVERRDTAGRDCRYYRSDGTPFVRYRLYRVCFADDRLVSKTVVDRAT